MDQNEIRRNDAERDRLLHVNAPIPGTKLLQKLLTNEKIVDLQRLTRERDQLLRKIHAVRELAEHYTGDLWPREVKDAAATILELLDKDTQEAGPEFGPGLNLPAVEVPAGFKPYCQCAHHWLDHRVVDGRRMCPNWKCCCTDYKEMFFTDPRLERPE